MTASLVRGKYVASSLASGDTRIISNGAVYQVDGRIAEVGDFELLRSRYPEAELLGSAEDVVLPGFVNAHHHVGLTPFQLGSPDLPLELWGTSRLGARPVPPYLDTLFSAFELVASGVTTVQHIQGRMLGPHDRWPATIDEVLDAYRDIGMRVSFSVNLRDQSRLIYGDDEAFVAELPPALRAYLEEMLRAQSMPFGDQLELLFVDLRHRWDHDRVRVQLAPANYHWLSDRALDEVRSLSERFQTPMHMHLLETPYQKVYAQRRCGGSVVRRLHEIGILGPRLTLGHAVWVNEDDIDLLASSGSRVCHNASSNLRLRSGLAPVNDLVQRGVPVAIGLDEAGINDDRDILQEMRLVLNLHRLPGLESFVLTSDHVLAMATHVGAGTTGFGDEIGSIAPGRAADLVLIDWAQVAYPFLDEEVPVVDAIIHRARSAHIRHVIVGGETIYQDGQFTKVDRALILREIASSLSGPVSGEVKLRREMARSLLPHVTEYYRDWLRDWDLRSTR